MAITERTERLKDNCWWKHCRGGEYVESGVKVGMERVRFFTQGHKEAEAETEIIRRARALENGS